MCQSRLGLICLGVLVLEGSGYLLLLLDEPLMIECILYVDKTACAVTIRVGIQGLFIPSVQLHSSVHQRCFKLIHGVEFGVVSRETVEFKSGEL